MATFWGYTSELAAYESIDDLSNIVGCMCTHLDGY